MPMTDAELLERMRTLKPPTSALLGLDLLALDSAAGTTRYRMRVRRDFCNPMGNMQGGIVTTLLDDAAATAIIVKSGRRIAVPTIEFKVSFFGPARLDTEVFADGRCLKLGRTIAYAEADLTDSAGKLLARLSTSAMPVELAGEGMFVGASR